MNVNQIELEKKWLLKSIPNLTKTEGFQLISRETFRQSYLNSEERLRWTLSTSNTEDKLEYFKKVNISEGKCSEELKTLTEEEYIELVSKQISWLQKVRTTYIGPDSFKYEFDDIKYRDKNNRSQFMLLEIEFQDKYSDMTEVDSAFKLPEILDPHVMMDVTGNNKFSNYYLSL